MSGSGSQSFGSLSGSSGSGCPCAVSTSGILTITDNGNGTATATVLGSVPGSCNILYYSIYSGVNYNGVNPISPWVALGSIQGDGEIQIGVGPGFYFWQVVSCSGSNVEVSSPVIQNIADPTLCPHDQILNAVVIGAQSLNLAGIQSVVRNWVPQWTSGQVNFPLPILSLSIPLPEKYNNKLNSQDDIGYPIMAILFDAQKTNNTTNQSRNLKWRWQLQSFFRYQRLAGVSNVFISDIETQPIVDIPDFWLGYFNSGCLFWFWTRELRGLKP